MMLLVVYFAYILCLIVSSYRILLMSYELKYITILFYNKFTASSVCYPTVHSLMMFIMLGICITVNHHAYLSHHVMGIIGHQIDERHSSHSMTSARHYYTS